MCTSIRIYETVFNFIPSTRSYEKEVYFEPYIRIWLLVEIVRPGQRPQWSKKKNRLHQEEGNSNVNQVNLMDFKSGFSKKKTSLMEVGTCSIDMSPTSTGAKWLSPMLTPALVVPCWLDQLTIREVQFLLEPSELNEYQDISYHQ